MNTREELQKECDEANAHCELISDLLFNAMHELSDLRIMSDVVIAEMVDEKEVEKALSHQSRKTLAEIQGKAIKKAVYDAETVTITSARICSFSDLTTYLNNYADQLINK